MRTKSCRSTARLLTVALTVGVAATLVGAPAVRADTLIVENLQQAQASATDRPTRGMSMQSVSAKWGQPAGKGAAVGQPPITRWDYGSFVVFFEYDHVIHAVTAQR